MAHQHQVYTTHAGREVNGRRTMAESYKMRTCIPCVSGGLVEGECGARWCWLLVGVAEAWWWRRQLWISRDGLSRSTGINGMEERVAASLTSCFRPG